MAIINPTNLDYLLDDLRLHLGDINPQQYRYLDEWLRTALVLAVKNLQRWWGYKYLIYEDTNNIYRNPEAPFLYEEDELPPILDHSDERPVILMAAIIVKQGSLQNASWDFASWRDAEVSYSAQSVEKALGESLKMDRAELELYLKPPQKHLAYPQKKHLLGYTKNEYERDTTEPG